MKSPNTLLLSRKDLRPNQVNVDASKINLVESFGVHCSQSIKEAEIVIFLDLDRTTRILKNKWGMVGIVGLPKF